MIVAAMALLTLCLARSSFGQECKQSSGDRWNPPSVGPIVTWTAPTCSKGSLIVQPFFFYNRARGVFNEEGHYKAFKSGEARSQYQEQLFVQYGITDRFEIDAQGVYQQNVARQDGDSASATGFGDTYMFLRYCLLEEKKWLPCTTAVFQLKFPTGKYQKSKPGMLDTDLMGSTSGGGDYDTGYGLNFTKRIKPFILHADFLFGFPIETRVDGVNMRYGSYLNYDAAVEYFFYGPLNLLVEATGFIQGDRREDGYLTPATDVKYLNLIAGLGWSDSKIQMLVAYQRTVAGTNVNVDDSVIATFVYTF
jgi:hypothetical protein